MFYNLPSSKILSGGSATGASGMIYKGEDIAAALSAYGLGCKFICADAAPQVITYHFDLSDPMQRNSVKRYVLPVSAMLRCKVAVVDWICENADEFQIINACVEHFKRYVYDENGNYLIGGEVRYNFIVDACCLLTA